MLARLNPSVQMKRKMNKEWSAKKRNCLKIISLRKDKSKMDNCFWVKRKKVGVEYVRFMNWFDFVIFGRFNNNFYIIDL
jgi:hypothetical protein